LTWTIAKREILGNFMSLKFMLGTLLCLALIVISTIVSLQYYQTRMDEYDAEFAQYDKENDFPFVFSIPGNSENKIGGRLITEQNIDANIWE
jgi:hypothetical protein